MPLSAKTRAKTTNHNTLTTTRQQSSHSSSELSTHNATSNKKEESLCFLFDKIIKFQGKLVMSPQLLIVTATILVFSFFQKLSANALIEKHSPISRETHLLLPSGPKRILSLSGGKIKKKSTSKESDIRTENFLLEKLRALIKLLKSFIYTPKQGKRYGNSKSTNEDHLTRSYKPGEANARIQRELKLFLQSPPENCKVEVGSNIRQWIVTIVGAESTIYAGEKYKLKMIFPKEYPTKPPSVYFLKPCPKHMHVYTNGDICLNLLGRDWRPTMSAQILAASILSMLSNAKEKKLPQDNAMRKLF